MINNAPNPSESYISPCVIENVTVKTEFGESTVNVQAQMLISPNAYINLGEFNNDINSFELWRQHP